MSCRTPPLVSRERHHPPVPGEHGYYDKMSTKIPYLIEPSFRVINFSTTAELEPRPAFTTYHGIVKHALTAAPHMF